MTSTPFKQYYRVNEVAEYFAISIHTSLSDMIGLMWGDKIGLIMLFNFLALQIDLQVMFYVLPCDTLTYFINEFSMVVALSQSPS